MNAENVTGVLFGIAMVVVIVVGVLYISEHVSCFNFFGLAKGCVTH